jgi:alpha-L-fucosidase 2
VDCPLRCGFKKYSFVGNPITHFAGLHLLPQYFKYMNLSKKFYIKVIRLCNVRKQNVMNPALLVIILLIGLQQVSVSQPLPAVQLARKHAIVIEKPAPDFFEGALLGNGGMGVVVTTRPDAVVLYFGHNNVWDIRIAENHKQEIGTFKSVFNKISQISGDLKNLTDDPWYKEYNKLTTDNYSKPYPRPFPCGSLILGFDRRKIRLLGHNLDIANGLCEVTLIDEHQKKVKLLLFVNLKKDDLHLSLTGEDGKPVNNVFDRVKIIPDPSTPAEFLKVERRVDLANGLLAFRQVLPSLEPAAYVAQGNHPNDKAFTLTVRLNTALFKKSRKNWNGNTEEMAILEGALPKSKPFKAVISLENGLATAVGLQAQVQPIKPFNTLLKQNTLLWNAYWNRSAVKLSDAFLERIWYRNIYFLNCATRPDATCPGLFANWSYNNIGTAWHGDYHMNYNTQQPFWVTFSSNHIEKNLAYVNLIEALMPVSRKWAKDYYELPGAYFPHSAYPVEMTMNPYPVPDWGWEVSETPWAVQGLWWHYLYSGDKEFLKNRAFTPIKAAVEFLNAYMRRPEASGGSRWKDNNYHVFPTIPPELYGLQPGFRFNYDCTVDLSLIKFVFNAYTKAVRILNYEKEEHELLQKVSDILAHMPAYATTQSANYGKILVSVPGENDEVVYNVPNALFPVFPGEDVALMNDPENIQLLNNTLKNQQNEGGNDLVMINLQLARMGKLNLEQFKKQVLYCLMPNGTATDMVMQTNGRYSDASDFTYMSRMGVWTENFALPVVINECLMQSYNSTIRLFPNWPANKNASFSTLRAAGAFLVSAAQTNRKIMPVTILSEQGQELALENPWKDKSVKVQSRYGVRVLKGSIIHLKTKAGEKLTIAPF